MFLKFFLKLREAQVPVSLREYLVLLEGLEKEVTDRRIEDFYYLARCCLVKDERHFDKFDRVFSASFKGLETLGQAEAQAAETAEIPAEWLRKLAEKFLSEEEKAQLQALGWDRLMETLRQRLAEQKERHSGGNKWIGTGGTSPFGAYGYHPEGIRIGQAENRNFRAVKVWDKREFRDLDGTVELGIRSMKLVLRRLRKLARTGAAEELDLDDTIRASASQGFLDVRLRPERRNAAKVLLFFDIGGSMDAHVAAMEELFSAARSEFKHMDYFYFHNCLYEAVWKSNQRRREDQIATFDVLHKYTADYKIIVVGDAAMSPYEIVMTGGAVEHHNPEPGQVWLKRLTDTYPHVVWLNPTPRAHWRYTQSIGLIERLMSGRMFPLTLDGLDGAMRELTG